MYSLFICALLHYALVCTAHEESCVIDQDGECDGRKYSITNGKKVYRDCHKRGQWLSTVDWCSHLTSQTGCMSVVAVQ